LFLPAAGYRGNGNGALLSRGYIGFYWSTRRNSVASYAYYLYFYSGRTSANNALYRAYGFSVRCIAE
jgi:hypothetical protein